MPLKFHQNFIFFIIIIIKKNVNNIHLINKCFWGEILNIKINFWQFMGLDSQTQSKFHIDNNIKLFGRF